MTQSIFILILSIWLVQAYPDNKLPDTRSTFPAQQRYTNTINALNTKTTTGAAAVSKDLMNKTLISIASVTTGLDYFNWNINTAKTQSQGITISLMMSLSGTSCDDIQNAFMLCTGVLNSSISHLAKLNSTAATIFQTKVNAIVADIYKVYTVMKQYQKPLMFLYVTTPDATIDLMCSIFNNISTTMNDIALNYTQTLLIPAVVACADYGSNGMKSNLSKIVTVNNIIMNNSMTVATSALPPYIPDVSGVLPYLQNGIIDPFKGIQEQSLIIESMCRLTTTTSTTTTTTTTTTTVSLF